MKWIVQLRNGSRLIIEGGEGEHSPDHDMGCVVFYDDECEPTVRVEAETILYYGRDDYMQEIIIQPKQEGDDPFAGLMPSTKAGSKMEGVFTVTA